MSHPVNVHIENKLNYLWVTLPSSLNMDNYQRVEEQILKNLQGNNLKVVIDFIETNYLYSSGIGLIIRLRNNIIKNKGSLWLVNVSQKCRDNFTSMKLDKILPIFSTDLEFELSQESFWENIASGQSTKFLCVHQIKNDICHINLTGRMVATNDISSFNPSLFSDTISCYIFDLTGLEMIDSYGTQVLMDFICKLKDNKAHCTSYGARVMVEELMELLGMVKYISNYTNESQALKALKKENSAES